MAWKKQGAAVVGIALRTDGTSAVILLIGPRTDPRNAAVARSKEDTPAPLADCLGQFQPATVVEILCMQERVFGNNPELEPPRSLRQA